MTKPAPQTLRALLFGLSFVTLTVAAQAQANVWTGPAVGDWSDAANWSLGVVPQAASSPPDPLGVSVLLDTNPGQNSSVLLEGTFSIGSLAIDVGDTLTIADDASLQVGPVLNSGNIHIVGQGLGLRAYGTLTNAPGGLLSLDNGLFSSFRNSSFWNQSTTEGYGTIRKFAIQNDNLIDANVLGEQLTLVGKTLSAFHNTFLRNPGTMRASNGGFLRLADWQAGGILNHGNGQAGAIEAWGDSTVLIESSPITGGRIATSSIGGVEEGQIQFSGEITLAGVELNALTSFARSSNMVGLGLSNSNFANKKTVSLDGENLLISGVNVLSGGGIFKLSGFANVFSRSSGFGQVTPKFVNVDNTVLVPSGEAATFGKEMLVENRGIFEANGSNPFASPSLTLDMSGPDDLAPGEAAWTNSGIIRAVNGGRITFNSNGNDTVIENAGGVIEVGEGSRMSLPQVRIRGGTILGPDTVPAVVLPFAGEATLENVRLEGAVSWQQKLTLIGNIENAGLLKSSDGILIASEEVTLTGGGVFSLASVDGYSSFSDPPSKLINAESTLLLDSGTEFYDVTFVNRSIVEAIDPNRSYSLSFNSFHFPDEKMINSGVIRASGGATLEIELSNRAIQNYELDEFGNVLPGTIYAGAGSEVRLTGVSGGVLQAADGGVIRILDDGFLNSLNTPTEMHLLGRIEAEYIGLGGTIRNDGQLVVSGNINEGSTSSSPRWRVHLIGDGVLQLDGSLNIRSNLTFLNGPDHTIVGSGEIRSEGSFFTNEGRIEANTNNTLTITHTGPAFLFQQRGELIGSGNARLNIEGVSDWANDGLIESRDSAIVEIHFGGLLTNRGTMRVAEGAVVSLLGDFSDSGHQLVNAQGAKLEVEGQWFLQNGDVVNQAGGTVTGTGQIDLSVGPTTGQRFFNQGTLAPGNTVGKLAILGDFEQSATGEIKIELGGTETDQYDSLSAWSADLAGLLEVSLVDLGDGPFAPELGDSFEIIELINGSVTGEFDTFLLPTLAADLLWGIQYNPTSVVLEILAPLQADLDQDGDVDGNDFLLVQRDDPSLISQWQTEYGSRVISSLAPSQAVPEPTTLALALFALAVFTGRARNSASQVAKNRL